jgi:hypothetical protein
MTTSPFAAPSAPGSGIKWDDVNGCLLLITPLALEQGIATTFGPADAVRADVAILDGPTAGTEHLDTLVFPKVLSGQLTRHIGTQVLGRLGQGVAKPGQSAPWVLAEATPADVELGQRWLASRAPQFAAPAPAAPQQAAVQGAPVPF